MSNTTGSIYDGTPIAKPRSECDTFSISRANMKSNEPTKTMTALNSRGELWSGAPTIDDFEIMKPISRGAFGKVFLGRRKGSYHNKKARNTYKV